jgi:flagellar hook protein FlgE
MYPAGEYDLAGFAVGAGLTDLIIYQRAYDAAAKLITTGDQMIQKALQMHR